MKRIKVGDYVRSYDFHGNRRCYVEGVVEAIGPWEHCPCGQPHVTIRTHRKVVDGAEEGGFAPLYFPPEDGNMIEVLTAHSPTPSETKFEHRGFTYLPWKDYEDDNVKTFHDVLTPNGYRTCIEDGPVPDGMTFVSTYSELTEEQFRSWVDKYLGGGK